MNMHVRIQNIQHNVGKKGMNENIYNFRLQRHLLLLKWIEYDGEQTYREAVFNNCCESL